MTATFLPYGRQQITDADVDAVVAALRSELITQGPLVPRFEAALAEYVGARHAIAFSSGTAALHGACFAAGVGPGDETITAPITFAASANCALYCGATPRFADIDPATLNLDPVAAAAAAGPATKAVIPVSFAGLPADVDALAPLRERGIAIIEDAAHAIGAHRENRRLGGGAAGADMTCFSFHPVKTMTTGEGGLVTTEDDELARRLRVFRTHGITKDGISPGPDEGDWYYEMQELGFNFRITDIQCALGLSQLGRLDDFVARRNAIASAYRGALAGEERVSLPPEAPHDSLHAYHLFVVQVRGGAALRRRVFEHLRAAGIGVQVHYIPVYRLPYYRDRLGYPQEGCPHAEDYYAGAISLPMFPAMTEADVERVVGELREALA
jgi:UDP-4-amino-4,6-dideoxy-N-acetyl-beta-L-altrosamine transaminase